MQNITRKQDLTIILARMMGDASGGTEERRVTTYPVLGMAFGKLLMIMR
ncbi:hypothetical protein H6F61_23660 [Cyanobacteria bacterium FACHB-472]|nr:hypothetical protein [Cyanobacteria bacterium FACHB-472]